MVVTEVSKLNERIDPIELLQFIGYEKSHPKASGSEVRDYCPIHRGDKQQSLAINTKDHCFFCHSCNASGDLIDLYRRATGTDFPTAINQLASRFAIDLLPGPSQEIVFPSHRKEEPQTTYTTSTVFDDTKDTSSNLAATKWSEVREEGNHEYFAKKKVSSCPGIRYGNDKMGNWSIVVPFYSINGEIQTLQYINNEGKFFLSGTHKKGGFFPLGDIKDEGRVYVAEGLATAITIWEALGKETPVVSAGDAGNISTVVSELRKKYKKLEIVLALDNDKAGTDVKDKVEPPFTYCIPSFEGLSIPEGIKAKDFNDLRSVYGQPLDKLKDQLKNVSTIEIDPVNQSIFPILPMEDRITAHNEMLSLYRGKKYLGLRVATLKEFNENLKGLRKLILLAAAPNVGKTALTIQLAQEVLSEEKEACLVYISLEMTKEEIFTRMYLCESELDFDTYVLGSGQKEAGTDPQFSQEELGKIENAKSKFEQIGSRLQIIDSSTFNSTINAESIITYIECLKNTTRCTRVIVIIDYLQVWPIPEGQRFTSDLEADKWRIGEVKKIRDAVNKVHQDPVIVISEARKPSNNDETWGGGLSDVMGSARGGYTPDVVMLLSQLQPKALLKIWEKLAKSKGVPETHEHDDLDGDSRIFAEIISLLSKHGMAPCKLVVPKVRDGMKRFSLLLMFHFRKNRFTQFECPELKNLVISIGRGKK
jgi:hypothetical protein